MYQSSAEAPIFLLDGFVAPARPGLRSVARSDVKPTSPDAQVRADVRIVTTVQIAMRACPEPMSENACIMRPHCPHRTRPVRHTDSPRSSSMIVMLGGVPPNLKAECFV